MLLSFVLFQVLLFFFKFLTTLCIFGEPFFLNYCSLHNSLHVFVDDRIGRIVWFNDCVPKASELFMIFFSILIRLLLYLSLLLLWTLSRMVTLLPFLQQNTPISLTNACIYLGAFFFYSSRAIYSCSDSDYFSLFSIALCMHL